MDLDIINDLLQKPYNSDELKHLANKEKPNYGADYVVVEKV